MQIDEDSRIQLQRIVKRSSDWRKRERAQTLLRLDAGLFAQAVADQQHRVWCESAYAIL